MKNTSKLIFIFLSTILLCSCWDNVELENRGFIISLGIDKQDNSYNISLEMPNLSPDKSENNTKTVKTSVGSSFSEALHQSDAFSNKEISLAHTKTVIFSEEILDNSKMFYQIMDALSRDREISSKILILATQNSAADILAHDEKDEHSAGVYISNMYSKNSSLSSYKLDMDKIIRDFAEENFTIIPAIVLENEELKFCGGSVVADYELKGWLEEKSMRGLLWLRAKGKGERIKAQASGENFVLNVTQSKSKISFTGNEKNITAFVTIDISGNIEEFSSNMEFDLFDQQAKTAFKEAVESEILSAYENLYENYGVDGFSLKRSLEKKDPALYNAFFEKEENSYLDIDIVFNINIEIVGLGSHL